MFLFLINIIIVVHFAALAPQNSRRLAGNWREVAVCTPFYKEVDGFDSICSCICPLFYQRISLHMFFVHFKGGLPWCVMACVYNAVLQQFSSLLTAETNYVCNAGLGKCFLTACQYD